MPKEAVIRERLESGHGQRPLRPIMCRPFQANSRQLTGYKQAFDGSAAFNDRSWRDTSHSPSLLGCLEDGHKSHLRACL
jgi:hypothetical protein